jgi:glycosyltransferase involved in cell wall biosynthesis
MKTLIDRKIPILHVLNSCSDGSITRIVERIISFSNGRNFEWHVCSVKGQDGYSKDFERLNVKVHDFSTGSSEKPWKMLGQYIEDNQIRIVHSHTPRTILEVWKAFNLLGNGAGSKPIHLATKHLLTKSNDRKWGAIFTLYDRMTLYIPDHIVPVSRTMANEIISHPGLNASKVSAIPNAIPVDEYFKPEKRELCRLELGLSGDMLTIGFTGRIEKVKNLDALLRAMQPVVKQYPNTRLVIIGEGILQSSLEKLAQDLAIDHAIIWTGFCSNIPRMLSALDIYVQPSLNEGLSLSILEAMAAEKPVIATRVGSAEEIIENGKTGVLINPGSQDELTASILKLIENPDFRNILARKGKEHVVENFSIQKMVNGYLDVYEKLDEGK